MSDPANTLARTCPDCGFDLRGAVVEEAWVRCPECGKDHPLVDVVGRTPWQRTGTFADWRRTMMLCLRRPGDAAVVVAGRSRRSTLKVNGLCLCAFAAAQSGPCCPVIVIPALMIAFVAALVGVVFLVGGLLIPQPVAPERRDEYLGHALFPMVGAAAVGLPQGIVVSFVAGMVTGDEWWWFAGVAVAVLYDVVGCALACLFLVKSKRALYRDAERIVHG